MSGRIFQAGLRLVSNVFLSHLLFPEAFGLMGMVNVLLMGLSLFSDTGVRPSIVRSERGEDPAFLATAWTLQVFRGSLLFALCWLCAGPFARLYEEPELLRLVPLAGITCLLSGLNSTNLYLADRRMVQGRKFFVQLLSQACGIVTTLVWAWIDRSVMALLVGNIVSCVVLTVLSHTMLPGPRAYFHLERAAMREQLGFGRWILLSTALTFLAMQGDRLFLGYALLLGPLGLYFLACHIVELSTSMQGTVAINVVFPTWVESARLDEANHVSRVKRSRYALDSIAMAGLILIATMAPALFRLFYDERYQEVAILVQLLCFAAWFENLKLTATSAVLAYGDTRALFAANLVLMLVKIPASIGGFYLAGMTGFIMGNALGNIAGLLPIHMSLSGRNCRMLIQDLVLTGKCAIFLALGTLLPLLAADRSVASRVLIEGCLALVLCLIAVSPARMLLTRWKK